MLSNGALLIGSLFLVFLFFSRKWQLVSTSPRPPGARPKSGNIPWSTKNRFRLSIWTKSGPKASAADSVRFGACGAEFSCFVFGAVFLEFPYLCPSVPVLLRVRVRVRLCLSVCVYLRLSPPLYVCPESNTRPSLLFLPPENCYSIELSGCPGPEAWSRRCLQGWSPGASSP